MDLMKPMPVINVTKDTRVIVQGEAPQLVILVAIQTTSRKLGFLWSPSPDARVIEGKRNP
jgi:hypothetical protein